MAVAAGQARLANCLVGVDIAVNSVVVCGFVQVIVAVVRMDGEKLPSRTVVASCRPGTAAARRIAGRHNAAAAEFEVAHLADSLDIPGSAHVDKENWMRRMEMGMDMDIAYLAPVVVVVVVVVVGMASAGSFPPESQIEIEQHSARLQEE